MKANNVCEISENLFKVRSVTHIASSWKVSQANIVPGFDIKTTYWY